MASLGPAWIAISERVGPYLSKQVVTTDLRLTTLNGRIGRSVVEAVGPHPGFAPLEGAPYRCPPPRLFTLAVLQGQISFRAFSSLQLALIGTTRHLEATIRPHTRSDDARDAVDGDCTWSLH